MKNHNMKTTGKIVFSLSVALLLSGCEMLDFLSSKIKSGSCCSSKKHTHADTKIATHDTSKVLLTIGGKPAITENDFNEYYDQFIASNPRMQAMIQFMPNAKKEIFNGMVNERLLLAWGEKNNIHQSDDYQKELEQGMRMVKMGLAAKQFEKDVIGKITITDAQMRDYYQAHKDPELIAVPGGIKVQGVSFDTKEKAEQFLDRVKNTPQEFKKLAGKQDVKEFAPITQNSFDIDKDVKEAVLAVTSYPKALLVKASDNKYWVVVALEKQKTEYRSFEEVKDGIKSMIEREKAMKIYTDKLAELKKEYDVVEDDAFFAQNMPAMPMMPGMETDQNMQSQTMQKSA